jgi:hypothetical protein
MERGDKPKKLSTKEMEQQLKGETFPTDWGDFLDDDIRDFFTALLEKTKQKKSDVIRKANIARTYGYQLMEGRRLGKRDYYISIALAMSLDISDTQRMLAVTHCGALHPLIKRDAAVMFAVNNKYDCDKLYDFLCELGLTPLDVGLNEDG